MSLLFSQHYRQEIERGALVIDIPYAARRKIWKWLSTNDRTFKIQLDPNGHCFSGLSILENIKGGLITEDSDGYFPRSGSWSDAKDFLQQIILNDKSCNINDVSRSSMQIMPHVDEAGEKALSQIIKDKGSLSDIIQIISRHANNVGKDALRRCVKDKGCGVFDIIQVASRYMDDAAKKALRQKINEIFKMEDCYWRMSSDGGFYKLDADFVGAELAASAHNRLAKTRFKGATEEYAKARQNLNTGNIKEAISSAGNSFESIMKMLTGPGFEHKAANALIEKLGEQSFFDDLPEDVRGGFMDQVLKALPFLRNKISNSHGRPDVEDIPPAYGNLAVEIAAAFLNFLVTKDQERPASPAPEPETAGS